MKHIKEELKKLVDLITKKERIKNEKLNQLATQIEVLTTDNSYHRKSINDEDYFGINHDPEFYLTR